MPDTAEAIIATEETNDTSKGAAGARPFAGHRGKRLTLSQRLFVLAAIALLPALSILAFNEYSLRQAREAEIKGYALRLSELASLELQRILTGVGALMVAVQNAPIVMSGNAESCAAYLQRLQTQLPQLAEIAVTDPSGRAWCQAGGGIDAMSPDTTAQLRRMTETQMVAVGEYGGTATGPVLRLGGRIRAGEETSGYVLAGLSLDWLGTLLRERDFVRGSALTIADRTGTILAREPFPERFVGTKIPEAFTDLVLAERPGTMQVLSQDGTRRVIGYYPATTPLGLYVSAGVSEDEAMQPVNEATARGLALAAAGGLVALLLAWLFGRAFIREPVLHLIDTIARWRRGERSARTAMQSQGAEIDSVGAAIDKLLDEIDAEQRARENAERHRDLLNAELDHRMKNLLATVQAVASQTFRDDTVTAEARAAFAGRLAVLSNAHGILTGNSWNSADIADVVHASIRAFDETRHSHFAIAGPALRIKPKAAMAFSMALHELATNAAKYGALSTPEGHVRIAWNIEKASTDPNFVLDWTESGGPNVVIPERRGFGSRMIEQALASEIGGRVRLEYKSEGLRCRIECRLADLGEAGSAADAQDVEALAEPVLVAP